MLRRIRTLYLIRNEKSFALALIAIAPPVLFTLVLVTLDNIEDHPENPFDQVGEDDIRLKVDQYVECLQTGSAAGVNGFLRETCRAA